MKIKEELKEALPLSSKNWITLQEVAELKGKTIGDLTIDMEPIIEFTFYESKESEQ
jgi:hypothetical protein